MAKKVVSTSLVFINGSRVRPGVEFLLPDGAKLTPQMRLASDPAPAPKGPEAPKSPNTLSQMSKTLKLPKNEELA